MPGFQTSNIDDKIFFLIEFRIGLLAVDVPDSGMEDEPETPPCAVCGKPAAVVINSVAWCESCFHEMGSCCGEWHGNEL